MATILITGCSKGIGLETALAFARAGHTVFATMRNPSQSPALASIAASEHLAITISAMDVDCDEQVRDGIAAMLAQGPIDVLVNNAGVEAVGSVEELPLSTFRSVMETNYFGAIRCIQAVAPGMRERQSGCIINVSSIAGRFSHPPLASYCASKWALEAMSECLAGEMKTFNVRVLLIEPGIIDTAMARRIETPAGATHYRQHARLATIFSTSLQQPVPPTLVAATILDVVVSGTWQLRHPRRPRCHNPASTGARRCPTKSGSTCTRPTMQPSGSPGRLETGREDPVRRRARLHTLRRYSLAQARFPRL